MDRVYDLIAERPETLAEFVPVEIRGELLRSIHALNFKCLPAGFGRIKRCVEHNAMGVEMGIEFPARIMPERRSDKVARHSFSSQAPLSDTSLGKPDRKSTRLNSS